MGPEVGKAGTGAVWGVERLEAMDARGGWLASAEDLRALRIGVRPSEKSKILNEKSIEIMFALPAGAAGKTKDGKPRDEYYGCGWEVEQYDDGTRTTWHNGSLPGTSTLLVRAATA